MITRLKPTVMFLEDWEKYGAVPQFSTKNSSFIKMCKLLETLGIQNYLFPLTLFDTTLEHVDPFDYSSINEEIAARIFLECRRNHWYFFREIVRVPMTGGEAIPFELHRGNLALIWCFYNDVDIGLVLPRQTGKTICTQAIVAHQMYFQGYNFDIAMLTKDTALLQDNVLRLKDIKDALPTYLIQKDADGKDKDAKEGLSYNALKNRYLTFVNANNPRDAQKIGRGATVPVVHIDEIAYFKYIWITFPTLMGATVRASEDAAKLGMRCSNIYTTTAGRTDDPSGSYTLRLFNSSAFFTEKYYDCKDKNDLHEVVRKNSKKGKLMIYAVFSHRQLGKTDEWLKQVIIRNEAKSIDEVERDYLNVWKSGSDIAALPPHLLDKMYKHAIAPYRTDIDNHGYVFKWFIPENEIETCSRYSYVIGMDSSEQIGLDDTALVVMRIRDMSVVATLRCNDLNIIPLAQFIVRLMTEIFPKSVLVPEVKSTGRAILDYVLSEFESRGINAWRRIYNHVVQHHQDENFRDFNIYTEPFNGINRKYFGYKTTGGSGENSRNMLYRNVMMRSLNINAHRVYDDYIIQQFAQLTIKNGRIDHQSGGHDDLAFAYLLASYFVFFGKNLNRYEIDTSELLSDVYFTMESGDINTNLNEQQTKMLQLYRELKKRLATLKSELSQLPNHTSPVILQRYMSEIKHLEDSLKLMNIKEPMVVDHQYHENTPAKQGFKPSQMDILSKIFI